jgi:hypothetical protein
MCPVGIPMGQTVLADTVRPSTTIPRRFFGVRRSGRFCQLDELDYTVWQTSWSTDSPAVVIDTVATRSNRPVEAVCAVLQDLVRNRLLLILKGNATDDWERLRALRPLPRSTVIGNSDEHQQEFRLLPPGCKSVVSLSGAAYLLWSSWDGTMDLAEAVDDAMVGTNLQPTIMRDQAVHLVRCAVEARFAFFDLRLLDTSPPIAELEPDLG